MVKPCDLALQEDLQGILRYGVRNVFLKLKTEQSFQKNCIFLMLCSFELRGSGDQACMHHYAVKSKVRQKTKLSHHHIMAMRQFESGSGIQRVFVTMSF